MHWGVRRFETESGHLTPAGKARYDGYNKAKEATKAAKKARDKAYNKANYSIDSKDQKAYDNSVGMYNLRKRQESDAKVRMKMNARAEAGKSAGKREQKLIDKFKEKGMTQEEAEVAAYKRAKLEKTLAIAGAVTLAAAAAYGAKKYHDYVSDEVLEVGKVSMKRVTKDNSDKLYDTFYAASSKRDANKYVGMYGTQIKQQGAGDVYQKTIDLKENIKIASTKNAKDTMASVMKNTSPENRRQILDELDSLNRQYQNNPLLRGSSQGKMLNKGLHDIANGKYDTKAAYDALNFNMTGGNQSKVYSEFKQALKDKGYSGIKDRNDEKYSGYDAKSARIIFDTSKVKVSDIRKLSDEEISKKNEEETINVILRASAKTLLPKAAVATAAMAGVNKAANTSRDNRAISEYKKEHPNTKLSNDEILENYYGGKK